MTDIQPQTISEAELESEQFLIIHIGDAPSNKSISGDSIRTKDSELWFFQVADKAQLSEAPVRLYNEDGTAQGPITSGAGNNYNQLFDTNGDDSLRNDDDDWTVYHFSIGVKQDDLRVYPRVPDNQNGGAFTYLTGDEPDPTAGDPFGYIDSAETDFEDPSIKLETIAWRTGTRSVHQYGFWNDGEVQLDPILSVKGAAYQLRPVVERDAMLNLLADAGRPDDKQQNHVRVVNFSRAALRTFSYSVPEEWKDAQNTLTIEQANLPEEIEEVVQRSNEGQSSSSGSQGNAVNGPGGAD